MKLLFIDNRPFATIFHGLLLDMMWDYGADGYKKVRAILPMGNDANYYRNHFLGGVDWKNFSVFCCDRNEFICGASR